MKLNFIRIFFLLFIFNIPNYLYAGDLLLGKEIASKVCSTCHGNVAGMNQVAQVQPLKMGQCVACHRANEASVGCETCHH